MVSHSRAFDDEILDVLLGMGNINTACLTI
jgi:hypothetical protein